MILDGSLWAEVVHGSMEGLISMKKLFIILILLLFHLSSWAGGVAMLGGGLGCNSYNCGFALDPNCVALYNFETTATLVNDSKGTNTLTNVNTVVEDAVNFKQGIGSANIEAGNSEYFTIADAALDAGFPWKSDDAIKRGSVCVWIKLETQTTDGIFSKWGTAGNRSITLYHAPNGATAQINLQISTDGTATEVLGTHASLLDLATWYHITASFDDTTRAWAIRVRDTNGAVVGTDLTGTSTGNIYVGNVAVYIGSVVTTNLFDGLMDEMVIFKDIITADEATAIAKGIYK